MNKSMEKKLRKKRVPANMYGADDVEALHQELTQNKGSGCTNHKADCSFICTKSGACSVCLFNIGNGEGKKLFEYWRKNKYVGVRHG
jgi:ferredoxin